MHHLQDDDNGANCKALTAVMNNAAATNDESSNGCIVTAFPTSGVATALQAHVMQ